MTEPQDVLADLRWLSDEASKLWWQPESPAERSKSAHLRVRAIADAAIAALVRTPETLDEKRDRRAREFTRWFLRQSRQRQREFVKSVFPNAFPEPAIDVERLAQAMNATMDARANIAAFRVAPESLNHAAARVLAAEYDQLAAPEIDIHLGMGSGSGEF